MSKLDLDLEKARKEREDLAKELENVENEAQETETMRKIKFIKSNSSLALWSNFSTQATSFVTICGLVVPSQNVSQSAPTSSSTTSSQILVVPT